VEAYNERVENALSNYQSKESYIIQESGRNENEQAIILISEGVYKGFGFIDSNDQYQSFSEYEEYITLRKDNIDTKRIINSYLNNTTDINMIHYDTIRL
jgi:DNA polymerase-3 subunit epsilon